MQVKLWKMKSLGKIKIKIKMGKVDVLMRPDVMFVGE